jgi:uncharacterized membrane protein
MTLVMSILHLVARFTCEGTPDRCLVVCGAPFPLCVRCMAVYAGLVLALAALFAVPRLRRASVSTAACYASCAGLLLMGVMGSLTVFADLDSPAWVRLAVGAIFGVSIAVLVKGRIAGWMHIEERGVQTPRDSAILGGASLLIIAAVVAAPFVGTSGVLTLAAVSFVGCLVAWGGITVLAVSGFVILARRLARILQARLS